MSVPAVLSLSLAPCVLQTGLEEWGQPEHTPGGAGQALWPTPLQASPQVHVDPVVWPPQPGGGLCRHAFPATVWCGLLILNYRLSIKAHANFFAKKG